MFRRKINQCNSCDSAAVKHWYFIVSFGDCEICHVSMTGREIYHVSKPQSNDSEIVLWTSYFQNWNWYL